MGLAELRTYLGEFWAFHRWVWEVHFELMDPLIANYFAFRATCVELGIDEQRRDPVLPRLRDEGHGDRPRAVGPDGGRPGTAVEIVAQGDTIHRTRSARCDASTTTPFRGGCADFNVFLNEYGWRTEGMCDPSLAPWVEDPTPMLSMITTFLRNGTDHDFAAAFGRRPSRNETSARPRARRRSTAPDLERFEAGLGACSPRQLRVVAGGAQLLYRLRAHIPLRMAALRIGEIVGAERRDDLIYLFRHELDAIAAGRLAYGEVRDIDRGTPGVLRGEPGAPRRRCRGCSAPRMPSTDDPIMKEIFGVDRRLLEAVGAADATRRRS